MPRPHRFLAGLTVSALVAGCASSDDAAGSGAAGRGDVALFDSSAVHEIAVEFDEADYEAMLDEYADSGEKTWMEATVTIDGTTFERVGMRLKGNSSLAGLGGGPGGPGGGLPGGGGPPGGGGFEGLGGASKDEPERLPWLIRLDELVDGQAYQGYEDLVIRSNGSATSLNEAVALDLLEEAELASQQAVATSFAVNDGEPALRLAIEHPDDGAWQERAFTGDGALYKAESTGDWSYRGDDPEEYTEIFDQEGGSDLTDLTPLIDFLQFLDESDDATFAAELPDRLDVDAFATYLAMMELVDNFDDIDGPGNNAYLWYDVDAKQFTIVAWDLNLAFGAGPGGGGVGGPPNLDDLPEGFEPPDGFDPSQLPEGFQPPEGFDPSQLPEGFQPPGGPGGRSNVLVERFHANAELEALYQAQLEELRSSLFDSGVAKDLLAARAQVLTDHADELVDEDTVQDEADRISEQLTSD